MRRFLLQISEPARSGRGSLSASLCSRLAIGNGLERRWLSASSRPPCYAWGAALGLWRAWCSPSPVFALLALMVALSASFRLLAGAPRPDRAYSVLPVLRNTVTGIRGVDPDVLEAATALRMTSRQRLRRVERHSLRRPSSRAFAPLRSGSSAPRRCRPRVGQPEPRQPPFSAAFRRRGTSPRCWSDASARLYSPFSSMPLARATEALARGGEYGRAATVGVGRIAGPAFAGLVPSAKRGCEHGPKATAATVGGQPGDLRADRCGVGAKAFTEQ